MTEIDLRTAGIPEPVVVAVAALTHRADQTRDEYYEAVRTNELALRVKLADIDDNSDPARLALLPAAVAERLATKYQLARAARHTLPQ